VNEEGVGRRLPVVRHPVRERQAAVANRFFTNQPLPARSAFGCAGLALGARVEIECAAAR
jgi:enamine deaminase RidA (YjgF/YER057c/UK114 family)